MERILVLVIALGVLSIGFGVLQRLWPQVRGQSFLRRQGIFVDVLWWLFTPTIGKAFTALVVGGSLIGLAAAFGMSLTPEELRENGLRETLISRQPFFLQFVAFLFLADFLAYWNHRAFHTFGRLWRMHAVHHSSTELDWLSSVRVHPLNDAIGSAVVAAPLLLLGFAPAALAAYLPFLTLYAIMLHANVDWSFGPLRKLVASPAYHRWHHAAEEEALDKNFAGLFPFYDRLFGTFYMPPQRKPQRFGVLGDAPPRGFVGQLLYPFRAPARVEAAAAEQMGPRRQTERPVIETGLSCVQRTSVTAASGTCSRCRPSLTGGVSRGGSTRCRRWTGSR
jgi:sterol desaturase/sphingolipid hydroxylase (fatty acid hydroxylase superfamily)